MIPLFFALLLTQDKAIFEGAVVNALTNEPLRKAHVVLGGDKNYAVVTGNEGKFRFEGIEPGDYQLEAQRQGFLDADDEWFELAPGEHVKDVVIKLTPQASIAGHVVDDDGDPVHTVYVTAARTVHVNGRAVALGRHQAITDTEGYFLLSELEAGRYYLSVEPSHHERQVFQPGHPGPEEEFVRTDDLVPRDVTAGAALRDIEVRIRETAVFRIRGRVSNPPKEVMGIRLVPPDGSVRQNDPQARLEEGVFEFAGIAPGSYVINFEHMGLYCRIPVTVADRDVDGIVAELAPGPNLEGTIKIAGGGNFSKPPAIQLAGNLGFNPTIAKDDGTFGWTNLGPRHYTLIYGPPEGFYIKSLQLNHQPVAGATIDLTSGIGGTLDIVVAPNAAAITATVQGGKKAKVTLWSDAMLSTSETDDSGTVSFTNLAPGEYRILAWQRVDEEYTRIREFLARFDAPKITLTEGSHETIEVKLTSKSVSDAEAAKLQ
jgi:hypothetical protein